MKITKLSADKPVPYIPAEKRRDPRNLDVDVATQQAMDKLNYYQKIREISDQANQDLASDPAAATTADPTSAVVPDAPVGTPEMADENSGYEELLREEATYNTTAAEAFRVIDTLTPEQMADLVRAYPDDILKLDEFKKQINTQDPEDKEECLANIVAVIEERPEVAALLAKDEVEDEDSGFSVPGATPIASPITPAAPPAPTTVASRVVTITKEAYFDIGKKANWI